MFMCVYVYVCVCICVCVCVYCPQKGSHLFAFERHHYECCTSWPWPKFFMNIMWLSRQRWELAKKWSSMTFIEVDTCHRLCSMRMLYAVTLTEMLNVKTIHMAILTSKGWKMQYYYQLGNDVITANDATANVVQHYCGQQF